MRDERKDEGAKVPAAERREQAEADLWRRLRPRTVMRAPADKMLRPGMLRGYETK